MPFASLKNTNTYYDIRGAGEPLILIHGLSVDSTVWAALLPYLEKHFQVIRLDLRGSGQTKFDGQAFSIDDLADDVTHLMDYLNINQAHIVGHSMGGLVAQSFAGRYSQKTNKLGIFNSRLKFTAVPQRFWDGAVHLRKKYHISLDDLRGITLSWGFSNAFLAKDDNIELMHQLTRNNPYPQSLENFCLQLEALKGFDGYAFIPNLIMPTLIVAGEADILAPPKQMRELAKLLPQATYIEQEDGAHAPIVENPEWVANQLINFLRG